MPLTQCNFKCVRCGEESSTLVQVKEYRRTWVKGPSGYFEPTIVVTKNYRVVPLCECNTAGWDFQNNGQ